MRGDSGALVGAARHRGPRLGLAALYVGLRDKKRKRTHYQSRLSHNCSVLCLFNIVACQDEYLEGQQVFVCVTS